MEKRRVVITGMGAVTPIGHTAEESWQAVRQGVCGIAPITAYDTSLGWRYPNPKMEALFPLEAMGETAENIYARKWAFWQYTSTGVVPGISTDTDINVFAGSAKNWNKWVASVSR